MLQRQTVDGVTFYVSPLLRTAGVPHAFSTRIGGLSPPPFDSMNLGNPNGCDIQDDYERIWENYRILQRAAGCGAGELCRVHQVHGDAIVRIERDTPIDNSQKADALVSDDPARVLSVRVADCVPVLLATSDGRAVAAVHAGWRGVIAEIVVKAIGELQAIASEAGHIPLRSGWTEGPPSAPREATKIVAAIGPCIGFDAFEVGPEVLAEFTRAFGADAPIRARADGKGYVDLREAVRRQLIVAGLKADEIDMTDRCTYRDREEFFSHRRDNGVTGRMAAIIKANAE